MVLGRKTNYSLGVGTIMSKKFPYKQVIQNQLENAKNRAKYLELEVQKLTDITKKIRGGQSIMKKFLKEFHVRSLQASDH